MVKDSYELLLTKSKYLVGLQCAKYLWMCFHEKHKIPAFDKETQHRFDQGHLVGEFVKRLWPNGIDIHTEDFLENIKETKEHLKLRKPLFEAGIKSNRLFSRADVLEPVEKDKWDIIEVKSSTEVKDVNIQDVAFQKYVYEKEGLKIRRCFLMHVNNEFIKKGEINPKDFFVKEEITEKVDEEIKLVPARVKEMLKIIDSKNKPDNKICKNCDDPYRCPIKDECWNFLPENNVFDLYRGGKKCFELFEAGVLAIKDIPEQYELQDKQRIQHQCEKTGKPYIDSKKIEQFIKKLKYPLYFLDFETYGTVIPLYDGLKPYQQIPFQFSLHTLDKKGEKEHFSFIAEGSEDSRPEFINVLKKKIGKKGSIVVYNQGFESGVLNKLAEFMPKEKKVIESITKRMIDLLIPFREFSYYHPKQQGSASLKAVLPAITEKSYADMEIACGGDASLNYLFITHGAYDGTKATKEEIAKIRADLEKYCGLDTEGMIWILERLRGNVKE